METDLLNEYQQQSGAIIARNKSVPDILSKLHCACSRAARSVVKAATSCGCIEINGKKTLPTEAGSQITGRLCEDCRATIETELGEALFYTVSLCNALGLNADEIIRRDMARCDMLGRYSLR